MKLLKAFAMLILVGFLASAVGASVPDGATTESPPGIYLSDYNATVDLAVAPAYQVVRIQGSTECSLIAPLVIIIEQISELQIVRRITNKTKNRNKPDVKPVLLFRKSIKDTNNSVTSPSHTITNYVRYL